MIFCEALLKVQWEPGALLATVLFSACSVDCFYHGDHETVVYVILTTSVVG